MDGEGWDYDNVEQDSHENRAWSALWSEEEETVVKQQLMNSTSFSSWLPPVLQLEFCFTGGGKMSGTEEAE